MREFGHDQAQDIARSVKHEFHTPHAVKLLGAAGSFEQSLLSVSSQHNEGEYARLFYGIAPGKREGAPYLTIDAHNKVLQEIAQRVNAKWPVFHPAVSTTDGGMLFGHVEAVDTLEDASKPLRREARHVTTMATLYPDVEYLQLIQEIDAARHRLEPEVLQELSHLRKGMNGYQLVEYGKDPQAFVASVRKKLG